MSEQAKRDLYREAMEAAVEALAVLRATDAPEGAFVTSRIGVLIQALAVQQEAIRLFGRVAQGLAGEVEELGKAIVQMIEAHKQQAG